MASKDAAPPGRPLQVVIVSSEEGEPPIKLNEDALEELKESFARTREQHGELPMVIHSAAGAFREGKSFILDCFLRYLHHLETADEEDLVLEGDVESSFMDDCNLMSPLEDGSIMFESRSSTDRVTSGIWFYSRLFVVPTESGQKVAVLLMDTQGLFDTAAASQLDAPIFALSVLLSSKQIINKRGQFNTNDWQMLNLFTEFANEIVRRLHRGKDPELLGTYAFQELQFLARDFQNFDMSYDDIGLPDEAGRTITMEMFLAHCTESSNEYMDNMQAQMEQHHGAISKRIRALCSTISCVCLSHPGEKMTSKRWDGDAKALSDSFRVLTARYCRSSFQKPAIKCDVLGNKMTYDAFLDWVKQFTECMVTAVDSGQLPDVDEMVKVVTQHQLTTLAEQAVEGMKVTFNREGQDGTKHIPDGDLDELVKRVRTEQLEAFKAAAQFGPEEDIDTAVKSLEEKLDEVERTFRDRNKLAMAQILVFFAPYATFAVLFFALDWLSDWVCDSWSNTCVQASSVMAFYYTVVFVTLVGYMGLKYKDYGPQGLWQAVGPLVSKVCTNFELVRDKVKALAQGTADTSPAASPAASPGTASPSSSTDGAGKESKKDK